MGRPRSKIETSYPGYSMGVNYKTAMWNPHCQTRKNAGPLEELIENYEVIVNNDPDYAACSASQGGTYH